MFPPALVSAKFQKNYAEIHRRLEEMGYTSWGVIERKDFGIPQNRERIFIVSILGEFSYTFPKPFPLTKILSDYLEAEVDEKYYLNRKRIDIFYRRKYGEISTKRPIHRKRIQRKQRNC